MQVTMGDKLLPIFSRHHHELLTQGFKKTSDVSQINTPQISSATTKLVYLTRLKNM